jgi:ribonuclease HI
MISRPEPIAAILRALASGDQLTAAAAKAGCSTKDARDLLFAMADKISPVQNLETEAAEPVDVDTAIAYIDGGARGNPGPAGCGVFLLDPKGVELAECSHYLGKMTNNEAEYAGLLSALEKAIELGVKKLEIRSDSQLLVRQMQGKYKVKAQNLMPLFIRANQLIRSLSSVHFLHIPRDKNKEADRLANEAMDRGAEG